MEPGQRAYYGSTEWKTLRARVLREEPVCRLCRRLPSERVDHIDGRWQNGARSNLRGLCTLCERAWTARQHAAKRRGAKASAAGCDESGVPLDPAHHWR